jgi:hypothetical protein
MFGMLGILKDMTAVVVISVKQTATCPDSHGFWGRGCQSSAPLGSSIAFSSVVVAQSVLRTRL